MKCLATFEQVYHMIRAQKSFPILSRCGNESLLYQGYCGWEGRQCLLICPKSSNAILLGTGRTGEDYALIELNDRAVVAFHHGSHSILSSLNNGSLQGGWRMGFASPVCI